MSTLATQTISERPIYECVAPSNGTWENKYKNARVTPPIPDSSLDTFEFDRDLDPSEFKGNLDRATRSDMPYRVIPVSASSSERPLTPIEIEARRRDPEQRPVSLKDFEPSPIQDSEAEQVRRDIMLGLGGHVESLGKYG